MRPPEPTGEDTAPAQRLADEASRAARVRALATDPDVVALRVERVRVQVDRLMWSGIVLGLGFTMTNVQAFAAAGAPPWSTVWVAAWALDPMVSLVLIAVLRAEQVTARWQVRTGPWVRRARWGTLAATYIMNTWSAWAHGIPSQVVLHSVPPLVVFVAAEAVTGLREALSEAVHAAAGAHRAQPDRAQPARAASAGSTAPLLEPPATDEPADRTPATGPAPELSAGLPAEAVAAEVERGQSADPRVVELAELLAAGALVTGAQAAVLYRCSPRNGRRLLAAAQTLATTSTTTTPTSTQPDERADERADGAMVLAMPARAGWS